MKKNKFPGYSVYSSFSRFFIYSFLSPCIAINFAIAQTSSLFEHFTEKQGLPSEKVFDAAKSNDGSIWFSTSAGICRFDGFKFQKYSEKDGLPDSEISGLYTDPSGKLWCWSGEGRIFYFENNRFFSLEDNKKIIERIENKIINSICIEKPGNIWISTVIPGVLHKIVPGGNMEEVKFQGDNNFSFFIKQIGRGGYVYGSFKSKAENNKLLVFLNEVPFSVSLSEKGNFSKSSFAPLPNGEFLYAKGQELIHFKPGKIIQRSFTEKNIQDIMADSEGKIWVGLYLGGAICYPEGILNTSGMINYLGNKSVSSILEDNSGNIWFTTMEEGVFYLPARANLKYTSPVIYSQKEENTKEESPKALSNPSSGQTIAMPQQGFRVISTDTFLFDSVPPVIFISGVKIMEAETAVQKHYDLPHDKNFLKINFAGLAYGSPEALKYKYKLEGIDKSWVFTDNTFAQYTTLPSGEYFFLVKAMNKNGVWSDSAATVSFSIFAPYWKTWWFTSLILLAVAGGIFTLFFLRITQIKKREKEKAEITRQMAHAEMQALRAQMNPHFIFNTLSSIQHFITTNETEEALKYLSKFAKLMRKIMDNSKKSSLPIKEELEAVRLYLDLESLRFKNKFEYAISVEEQIDVNDDEIPPMLIQPYIENAILHGIMNREENSGKGIISININRKDDMIVCTIEDNGIGREKSMEINRSRKNNHISSGMSITKNRLEILNNLNKSNLSVNIRDLKNGEIALGTRVEIFIPL